MMTYRYAILLIILLGVMNIAAQDIPAEVSPATSNTAWTVIEREHEGVMMVLVPAGCFMMGDDPAIVAEKREDAAAIWPAMEPEFKEIVMATIEVSQHEICFEAPFWIDQTEVTQADFVRLDGRQASQPEFLGDLRPVENITWVEALAFCQQRGGRLPTEAEWEYAARGPDNWRFPWGNEWDATRVTWNRQESLGTTQVATNSENASWVGALDLSGNVWEWTSSQLSAYPYHAADGRELDGEDQLNAWRVLRGGSWANMNSDTMTTFFREWHHPQYHDISYGFRCVMSL